MSLSPQERVAVLTALMTILISFYTLQVSFTVAQHVLQQQNLVAMYITNETRKRKMFWMF
jgi:hypothetical protein